MFIGSVCWWVTAYKYPVARSSSSLPLSASILALAPLLSCAPSSSSELAFLPPKDACETRHRRRLAPVIDDGAPVVGAREGGAPTPPHIVVVTGVDCAVGGPPGA